MDVLEWLQSFRDILIARNVTGEAVELDENLSWSGAGGKLVMEWSWRKTCHGVELEENLSGSGAGGKLAMEWSWRKTCHGVELEESLSWSGAGGKLVMEWSWRKTCHGVKLEENLSWSRAGGKLVMQWNWRKDLSCNGSVMVKYLGDWVSEGGGCEAAATARTRCGWVELKECGELLYG